MLDPVSTRTIFPCPGTTPGNRSSAPRINARNLHEFVRTQSSLSSGNSVQIPRAANEHLSRVFPKSSGGSRQCDSGRKYSCAESGTKRLTRMQLRSILARQSCATAQKSSAFSNANDSTAHHLEHLYDLCLVWPPEIPQRSALEGDHGQLGDRLF